MGIPNGDDFSIQTRNFTSAYLRFSTGSCGDSCDCELKEEVVRHPWIPRRFVDPFRRHDSAVWDHYMSEGYHPVARLGSVLVVPTYQRHYCNCQSNGKIHLINGGTYWSAQMVVTHSATAPGPLFQEPTVAEMICALAQNSSLSRLYRRRWSCKEPHQKGLEVCISERQIITTCVFSEETPVTNFLWVLTAEDPKIDQPDRDKGHEVKNWF